MRVRRIPVGVITALAALGGFLFGYDTGVISGALLYIPHDIALSSFTKGAVVAALLLGAAVGAIAAGELAGRSGRKPTIVFAAILFVAGIVIAIITSNVWVLIAGRFVIGLGVGAASDTVPLYLSELAPPDVRGRLVSINQLMITSGIVIAYLVDYAFSSSGEWRWMLGVGIIPAAILGLGMLVMPRSPRWLAAQGRREEAEAVLESLGQGDVAEQELAEAEEGKALRRDWRALLRPNLRKVLVIGIGLAVLQQVTGINTVIYYAPTILKDAGLASGNSILAAIPVGVINVVMTIVSILIIDKVGRRPLLFVSLAGMVVAIGGLGLAFSAGAASWITVVCLIVYVASFAVGMGPVFWLLISEIYPQHIRGEAMSVATAANWLANFAVAQTFPLLISGIGRPATFWIYAGIGIVAIWFCIALVPETRGRSLEELETELVGGPALASEG